MGFWKFNAFSESIVSRGNQTYARACLRNHLFVWRQATQPKLGAPNPSIFLQKHRKPLKSGRSYAFFSSQPFSNPSILLQKHRKPLKSGRSYAFFNSKSFLNPSILLQKHRKPLKSDRSYAFFSSQPFSNSSILLQKHRKPLKSGKSYAFFSKSTLSKASSMLNPLHWGAPNSLYLCRHLSPLNRRAQLTLSVLSTHITYWFRDYVWSRYLTIHKSKTQ